LTGHSEALYTRTHLPTHTPAFPLHYPTHTHITPTMHTHFTCPCPSPAPPHRNTCPPSPFPPPTTTTTTYFPLPVPPSICLTHAAHTFVHTQFPSHRAVVPYPPCTGPHTHTTLLHAFYRCTHCAHAHRTLRAWLHARAFLTRCAAAPAHTPHRMPHLCHTRHMGSCLQTSTITALLPYLLPLLPYAH